MSGARPESAASSSGAGVHRLHRLSSWLGLYVYDGYEPAYGFTGY